MPERGERGCRWPGGRVAPDADPADDLLDWRSFAAIGASFREGEP